MKNQVTERLIKNYSTLNRNKLNKKETDYLRIYYSRLTKEDYNESYTKEMVEHALDHLKLANKRKSDETLIKAVDVTLVDKGHERQRTILYVVTEDVPFIIDSIQTRLNALLHPPLFTIHPIFAVKRDASNKLSSIISPNDDKAKNLNFESFTQISLDRLNKAEQQRVIDSILEAIDLIRTSVDDWQSMKDKVEVHAQDLKEKKMGASFAEHGELFDWFARDHFVFLGYVEVLVDEKKNKIDYKVDKKTARGILRNHKDILSVLPQLHTSKQSPVYITKTRQRSPILKSNYLDCALYDLDYKASKNKPHRFACILGFLSGSSAHIRVEDIPHIRNKANYVLESSGLRSRGYSYKQLRTVLERLPREKVFQMEVRALYPLCMSIISHQERRKTRVYINQNVYGHFFSCLVYVPRDLYSSKVRQKILAHLAEKFNTQDIEFDVYFSSSILSRIHFTIHCDDAKTKVNVSSLERSVQELVRDWNDNLHDVIKSEDSYERADQLLTEYREAFTSGYQDENTTAQAYRDIEVFESLSETHVAAQLQPLQQDSDNKKPTHASLRLYRLEDAIPLSDALPILENMGVRVIGEKPFTVTRKDEVSLQIHDFTITPKSGQAFDLKTDASLFEQTFIQCWNGTVENDGFNQLGMMAKLNYREISVIRAYFRYLKQIRLRYSESYIIETLAHNPDLIAAIAKYFIGLFDPTVSDKKRNLSAVERSIKRKHREVNTLDEDRIFSALLDVINATLRTNFFQPDDHGAAKDYISFKLSPRNIPRIPEPAPKYEIFVYSPRIEGVHLRGGDVARGGLRWSERPEDFRTEVLGLVKAQRVKNAVIVPVGSKGGFVAKQLPEGGDRNAIMEEVVASYKTFITGLLDVTDNLIDGKVIPPLEVARKDGDDPYLVVAADKGTATFSDIANGISESKNFWLGDAFASGGSVGYDHKKMGITARGAWESVKRHFREKGKDIQSTDFTVVGIGDMGGDVFGNGMLLSEHIQLVAAFNHMHIFIDPTPNTKKTFKERKRLFEMPRSSWADFNSQLISKGGGIYSRSEKSITVSEQAKKALGLSKTTYDPESLIHEILKSPVELIWNGGIGTYVKASSETDSDAQDRANDRLRVDASELRCQVIGEGGNLGVTQLARIEYAQLGGACYTDAIDNSAGVDTSDHEVNIKILLNDVIGQKKLSFAQRNSLLAKMEETVGHLVLKNNYVQTQTLSIEAEYSDTRMPQQSYAMGVLEEQGLLNRPLEFLPDDQTLEERYEAGEYLTRPELAVLLAYSKMDLYQQLLDSKVPDIRYLNQTLIDYFPEVLGKKYSDIIKSHRLKREIISTEVTNQLIGDLGPCAHIHLSALLGNSAEEITRAYLVAKEVVGSSPIITAIQALDNQVDAKLQMQLLAMVATIIEKAMIWLLRNMPQPIDISKSIDSFQSGFAEISKDIATRKAHPLNKRFSTNYNDYQKQGVPSGLAAQLASLQLLTYGIDMVALKNTTRANATTIADTFFGVSAHLDFAWLVDSINNLSAQNLWHARSRQSLLSQFRDAQQSITRSILAGTKGKAADQALDKWLKSHDKAISELQAMQADIQREQHTDFAMLSVIVNELNRLSDN